MVRLVFRPYTQIRRTICTSVSLQASIRVSPDFTLFKHSSPSFGSHHKCSNQDSFCKKPVNPAQKNQKVLKIKFKSLSFRSRVFNSLTHTYVRLLGPCFKTGWIRPSCQIQYNNVYSSINPHQSSTLKSDIKNFTRINQQIYTVSLVVLSSLCKP